MPSFGGSTSPRQCKPTTGRGADADNIWWTGDADQVGWFIHGYEFGWLPASLLQQQESLADALFAASRHWSVRLHFNKGLAGGLAPR